MIHHIYFESGFLSIFYGTAGTAFNNRSKLEILHVKVQIISMNSDHSITNVEVTNISEEENQV